MCSALGREEEVAAPTPGLRGQGLGAERSRLAGGETGSSGVPPPISVRPEAPPETGQVYLKPLSIREAVRYENACSGCAGGCCLGGQGTVMRREAEPITTSPSVL